jgi:hypothetical protein
MYRVELIPKQNTLLNIIGPWTDTGRPDNTADGQFVFENVAFLMVREGTIEIEANGKQYYYNMADFYRVKRIKIVNPDRDMFDDA